MNAIILAGNSPAVTMTSREIAELVEQRHDNVKRTIDILAGKGVVVRPQIEDEQSPDAMGRPRTTQVYRLDKRSSLIVVAQLCPEFTARLVDRWQELEAQAAAPILALPQDYIQALESLLASKKSERLAIEQRDLAIATKAQIGNRREATAMATASAAKKESAKLKAQLGFNANYATIIAVERADGRNFGTAEWRPLKAWCQANNEQPKTVPCQRYGKAQAWPAGAWLAVYGVTLSDMFGEVAA